MYTGLKLPLYKLQLPQVTRSLSQAFEKQRNLTPKQKLS
jgi:hypothetical protein